MRMHVKIGLLTLLLIFATVTTFVSTAVTLNIPAPEQSHELDDTASIVYYEVGPLGKEKGGGWG